MFTAFNLYLITMALSIVMLFVLFSLIGSKTGGVKEWWIANALAVVALLLFSARGKIPDVLSMDLANGLFLLLGAIMLIGFRRHFSRKVPTKALLAGGSFVFLVFLGFHYGLESMRLRTVAVSIFYSAISLAIGLTFRQSPKAARCRYSYRYTATVAMILAFGYGIRAIVYLVQENTPLSLFEPSARNLVFLSLGTLALPALTLGAVMMANDEIIAKAKHAANHDFLTGAWSRRAFFERAELERNRVLRLGGKLALLVFDVDHFKQINDTYGHAVGDQVLVDIVLRTEAAIRSIDCCARLGGEEFAVLLPDVERQDAVMVGERLRSSLAQPGSGGGFQSTTPYSVSIGVASLEDGESIAGLLRRADAALYVAKASGRNTVVCA